MVWILVMMWFIWVWLVVWWRGFYLGFWVLFLVRSWGRVLILDIWCVLVLFCLIGCWCYCCLMGFFLMLIFWFRVVVCLSLLCWGIVDIMRLCRCEWICGEVSIFGLLGSWCGVMILVWIRMFWCEGWFWWCCFILVWLMRLLWF